MGFVMAGLVGFGSTVLPADSAHAGGHKLTKEESTTVPVDGATRLYIKNPRGKTIVVGKKHATGVSIHAEKFVQAKDADAAEEWMEKLTFRVDTDGKQISLITNYPSGNEESFWAFLWGMRYKAAVRYTIEVPSTFGVEVSSASGDVQVTSVDGKCSVYGSSGEVFLKAIGGNVLVEVSSGDVEIMEVRADVELRSSSGDAVIRGAGGSISVSAASGDMEVHSVTGNARVELVSGDILIQGCDGDVESRTASGNAVLRHVLGSVHAVASSGDVTMDILPIDEKEFVVSTSSGDVSIVFETPESYGFLLDVSTSSGSIEGDLDIRLDKVSRRVLRGVVGNGNGKLLIETASGNIVIQQARMTTRR